MKWMLALSTVLVLLTACSTAPTDSSQADMPNPASAHCVEQGFKSEIRTAADGSQYGVCIFPDGSECDEWVFFRGECSPPAPISNTPQADMPNPAAAYCVEQGFRSEIRTAADGSQSGVCIFPDGNECDEWTYFRGECGPGSQVTEPTVAPTQMLVPSGEMVIPQPVVTPAGAIIDPRNDPLDLTEGLIFYSPDGLTLGELLAPRASAVHAAGRYGGALDFPLVFHSFEPESREHFLNINRGRTSAEPGGTISLLAPLDDEEMLSGLVGVPAEPILFYIVFQPVAPDRLHSRFFLGSLESIPTAAPVLTLDSRESSYWKPVAVQLRDREPAGLWFTRTPWGIGGEIVFPYYEGLSYLDLARNTVVEALPPGAQFNSLSSDQTRVVYSVRNGTGGELLVRNLLTEESLAIPCLPENDRGPGDGVLSPSSKYVAWREAQGSYFDGDFHQTVRVATLEGEIVGEFKDVSFYKTAELTDGTELKPLGWLDDEDLLVQVVAPEKPGGRGAVVRVNVVTGQFHRFAQGFFTGWFYP